MDLLKWLDRTKNFSDSVKFVFLSLVIVLILMLWMGLCAWLFARWLFTT
jgi:hypothetical protein